MLCRPQLEPRVKRFPSFPAPSLVAGSRPVRPPSWAPLPGPGTGSPCSWYPGRGGTGHSGADALQAPQEPWGPGLEAVGVQTKDAVVLRTQWVEDGSWRSSGVRVSLHLPGAARCAQKPRSPPFSKSPRLGFALTTLCPGIGIGLERSGKASLKGQGGARG